MLYALALEKLFRARPTVEAGRLYYCTSAGGFAERDVPLDATARARGRDWSRTRSASALAKPLPARGARRAGACRWCDYRAVCGPYEELRIARKPQPPAGARCDALRELP